MKKFLFLISIAVLIFSACQKNEYETRSLFFYPNCFTPNGDGLNDTWQPEGGITFDTIVNTYPAVNLNTYNLKIKNKKDKTLYVKETVYPGWDGTYKGDTCPSDYYYYYVTYESLSGKKYRDAGILELLR